MMPGLNYLGSSSGGAGTMPGSIPGMGAQGQPGPNMPLPAGNIPGGGGGAPLAGLMPSSMTTPTMPDYAAVTQADGSILLHLKNPDGSLGPAVKIVVPPKPKAAAGPSA